MACGIFRFIYLPVYLFIFGCAGSSLLHEVFSSYREWELHSSCGGWASYCGLRCLLLLQNRSSRVCSSQLLEYRLNRCGGWAQLLWSTWDLCRKEYWSGLPFPFCREFSQLRDETCVSCIGKWIFFCCFKSLSHQGILDRFFFFNKTKYAATLQVSNYKHLSKRSENLRSHKYLYTSVRSSIICDSSQMETTQMSFNKVSASTNCGTGLAKKFIWVFP